VGGGFFETDEYYRHEKERYWRSLELLCELNVVVPAKVLEIGGGQFSFLCKRLFGDDCTVADISERFNSPLLKEGIKFVTLNLMQPAPLNISDRFDVVVLLEVIEHIPLPAYVVVEHIKPLLKPKGILFLTTPNLFRIRNLARMFSGKEFLDRFMLPEPEHPLGHQLEYSADHLQWQLERAGMEVIILKHDQLGRTGHSLKARIVRKLLSPFYLRSIWQEGLVAAARER
jgi:2-polyprenyl-3-methyl-5-hydroxy-6-metoxy-1,4-benzoquinol methylase